MTDQKIDVEISEEDLDEMKGVPQKQAQMNEAEEIKKMMENIKHKIIVCSGKGGVGKTTVAVNLALELATQGLNVGILDVDITGPNVPKLLNLVGKRPEIIPGENKYIPINGPLNVKVMSMAFLLETDDTPVIWRGPLKMKAIRQFMAEGDWGNLDYLIADLPPGTSDETLDLMQLTKGSVVVVTTPQEVATLDSRKTIVMSKKMDLEVLGIVENMSGMIVECPKCGEKISVDLFGTGGGEKASKDMGVSLLGKIPIELSIREGGDKGAPFVLAQPDSVSTKVIKSITKKIRKKIE